MELRKLEKTELMKGIDSSKGQAEAARVSDVIKKHLFDMSENPIMSDSVIKSGVNVSMNLDKGLNELAGKEGVTAADYHNLLDETKRHFDDMSNWDRGQPMITSSIKGIRNIRTEIKNVLKDATIWGEARSKTSRCDFSYLRTPPRIEKGRLCGLLAKERRG
jgi:hypothetical protein